MRALTMAGNAIDPTAFEPRVTVPEPCAVEDTKQCVSIALAGACEALHGRGECLTFLASGDPIPRQWADTPVAPVPLPAALPLLLVAILILWRRS